MARKGAAQRGNLSGRPAGGAPPTAATGTLERALAALLAADAAVAVVILYIDARLRASGGSYVSFCNVSDRVNCDAVMTSAFGTLLGVSVAWWALATYALLALLLWRRGRVVGALRARTSLLLLTVAGWSALFSLYMALVAAFVIEAFCLLCAAMYVLNLAILVVAWRLALADRRAPGLAVSPGRAALVAGAMAGALALVAVSQFATAPRSALATLSPEEVRARDPEFYRWYTSRRVVDAVPAGGHARGAAGAPITIVEFSDFECPACAKAFRDLRELEREHHARVRVVFRHFPLDGACNPHVQGTMHARACTAAIAAECAGQAGRFWEYHDRLFEAPGELDRDALLVHAGALGLDRAAFVACLDGDEARARVVADADAGARLGVKSTPTLFINGRAVEGALERGAYEYVLAMEQH